MKFTIDPWDPAYGATVETEMQASTAPVRVDVEVEPRHWTPLHPDASTACPDVLVFVDGVRRIDARTWIDDADGTYAPGIFASYAAGTVRCDARARVVEVVVRRGVFAPASNLGDVPTRHGTFTATTVADATPEQLMYAVHAQMAEAEVEVAERTRRAGSELLLLDGPLRKRGHIPDAVGLIKSHQVRYLPPELESIVADLPFGTRTPAFLVEAQPFSRYSWYLRLPGPDGGPFAGVLRCEVTGALPIAEVTALADCVTGSLPRFASAPHKDSRAPQNLYPIGGLERELRHRLGDPHLCYRALRQAATVTRQAS